MRLILLFFSICLSVIFALAPPTAIDRKVNETSTFFDYMKYLDKFDPMRKLKTLMPKVEGKCHHLFIDAHDWTNVSKRHPIPHQVIKLQAIAKDEALFNVYYDQIHSIVSLLEEEKGNEPPLAKLNEIVFSMNFDIFFAAKLLKRYSEDFPADEEYVFRELHGPKLQDQWNVIATVLKQGSPCKTIYNQMKLFLKHLTSFEYKNELELGFFTTYNDVFNPIYSFLSKFYTVQHLAKELQKLLPNVADDPCDDSFVLNLLYRIRYQLQKEFYSLNFVQDLINDQKIDSLLVKKTFSIFLQILPLAVQPYFKISLQALYIYTPKATRITLFFWTLEKNDEGIFCKENSGNPSRPVEPHEIFTEPERPSSASHGPRVYDTIYDFFMSALAVFIQQDT